MIACDNRTQTARIGPICRALILKNCSCSFSLRPKVLKLFFPICACVLFRSCELSFVFTILLSFKWTNWNCLLLMINMCRFDLIDTESVIWRFSEGSAKMTHFGKKSWKSKGTPWTDAYTNPDTSQSINFADFYYGLKIDLSIFKKIIKPRVKIIIYQGPLSFLSIYLGDARTIGKKWKMMLEPLSRRLLTNWANPMSTVKGHPFGTYAKFSEKLTFLTPWYAHVRVRIKGKEMLIFRKILRTY